MRQDRKHKPITIASEEGQHPHVPQCSHHWPHVVLSLWGSGEESTSFSSDRGWRGLIRATVWWNHFTDTLNPHCNAISPTTPPHDTSQPSILLSVEIKVQNCSRRIELQIRRIRHMTNDICCGCYCLENRKWFCNWSRLQVIIFFCTIALFWFYSKQLKRRNEL